MNDYKVYKHTTPSGKCYIGITKQAPTKRWKNGRGYEGCTAFYRAVQKYGWGNIKHEILAENLTEKEACEKEQEYIKLYHSSEPEHGYNLTFGGEHYQQTEQSRQALSQSLKKYYSNDTNRAKISERQKGKRTSEETKAKMREARLKYISAHPEARELCRANFLGKKRSRENCEKLKAANEKPVICIDTGTVYRSTNAAAEYAGVTRTAITNHLRGRSKTCGGHTFQYANAQNGGTDNA